jgi:ketosteroid isomerase-like protein
MCNSYLKFRTTLLCIYLGSSLSSVFGQNSASTTIDLEKARKVIDSLDKKFAQHYYNGDSAAIYNMYAKGANFACMQGNEILLSWGRQIRNSIKNDTRNLIFTTNSLSTDSEFLVEVGAYEFKDSKGNSKEKGKYLVVWKQEEGNWKLYRDMGL